MLLSAFLIAAAAETSEPVLPGVDAVVASRDNAAVDGGGTKKKKKGKGKGTADEPSGSFLDGGKVGGWRYRPFASPGVGVILVTDATAFSAGADVGVKARNGSWIGELAVGGSYATGVVMQGQKFQKLGGLHGGDIHLGGNAGYRADAWSLTGGLVGFYNSYDNVPGGPTLPPTVGLDVPVEFTFWTNKQNSYHASITPSFVTNKLRKAEFLPYNGALGFGFGGSYEFAGFAVDLTANFRIDSLGLCWFPVLSVTFP